MAISRRKKVSLSSTVLNLQIRQEKQSLAAAAPPAVFVTPALPPSHDAQGTPLHVI